MMQIAIDVDIDPKDATRLTSLLESSLIIKALLRIASSQDKSVKASSMVRPSHLIEKWAARQVEKLNER